MFALLIIILFYSFHIGSCHHMYFHLSFLYVLLLFIAHLLFFLLLFSLPRTYIKYDYRAIRHGMVHLKNALAIFLCNKTKRLHCKYKRGCCITNHTVFCCFQLLVPTSRGLCVDVSKNVEHNHDSYVYAFYSCVCNECKNNNNNNNLMHLTLDSLIAVQTRTQ